MTAESQEVSVLKQAIPVLHMTSADDTEAFDCRGVTRDGVTLHLPSHAGVVGGVAPFIPGCPSVG